MISLTSGLLLGLLVGAHANPIQHPFVPEDDHVGFNPLKHLSAISPFYIPTNQPTPVPTGCELTQVALLIRHSAILGNDDEYEQTMGPFIKKVRKMQRKHKKRFPKEGKWAFLRDWKPMITEDKLEKLSERGKEDATYLGKYIRHQYDYLFPPANSSGSGQGGENQRETYKVWTASSTRDIETAKAYILGSFPRNQTGGDGTGDGDVVQLIEVPNYAKDWDRSLTPHKACDAFEKESSLKPANKWLSVYAPRIRKRLHTIMPKVAKRLNDQDVLAMQMLCGYESIASPHPATSPKSISPFCHAFTKDEWLDFEYYMDVRFHHMMGYGSDLAPYLGAPWARTAMHLLEGIDAHGSDADEGEHGELVAQKGKGGKGKLPGPEKPPNGTHTQLLHPHFTHRESPAFISVFLNLFNSSTLPWPASQTPPLDHRLPKERQWRTSHLVSFLGHIALERMTCSADPAEGEGEGEKADYVRAVVNGQHERMGGCEDGVEGTCSWDTFKGFVEERAERWGDWTGVCEKKH